MPVRLPTTCPAPTARAFLALSRARSTRLQLEELWNAPVVQKESNGAIGEAVFGQLIRRLSLALGAAPIDSWVEAEWEQLVERESVEYKLTKGVQTVETLMVRSLSFALFSKLMLDIVLQFATFEPNWKGAEDWLETQLENLRNCIMQRASPYSALEWRDLANVKEFTPTATSFPVPQPFKPAAKQQQQRPQSQQQNRPVRGLVSKVAQRPRTSPVTSSHNSRPFSPSEGSQRCSSAAMVLQNSLRPDSALEKSPGRLAHPSDTMTRPATAFVSHVYQPQPKGIASTPRSASAGHRDVWAAPAFGLIPTYKSRPGGRDPRPPYFAHPVGLRAGSDDSTGRLSRTEARKDINYNIKPQTRLDIKSGVWMPLKGQECTNNVCDIEEMNGLIDSIHARLNADNNVISLKKFNFEFERVDGNHDGKVTERELGLALYHLGCIESTDPAVRIIFRHFDNGDGVDYDELAWLFFQRRQMIHSIRQGSEEACVSAPTLDMQEELEYIPPPKLFAEGKSALEAPHKLRQLQADKKSSPCWNVVSNPVPLTGFGPSVFVPQTVAPIFQMHSERLGLVNGRPSAVSDGSNSAMQAEKPQSLHTLKEPLPWYKEKQLKQKMQQTLDNNGFTQNLRLSLHKDDNLDPSTGRQRRFAIAAQRRRVSRIARFTSGNNRHAADYGKAEQEENAVPESVKILQKQLADARARKAAGIEDSEEEKLKGHAAGVRVFGKLKQHISKNKSNVSTAFNEFDDDNSGALTPSELRECLGSLGIALEDDDFEVMCRLIDSDGDGTIDCGEFMDAVDHYSRLAEGKAARKVARKSGRSKDDLIYLDYAPPRVGIGIQSRVPKMPMP